MVLFSLSCCQLAIYIMLQSKIGLTINILCANKSNKILMIYNYHWSNYSSWSFIMIHYLPYFRNHFKYQTDVVFYGPQKDNVRGIKDNGLEPNGYYSYYTFVQAINNVNENYLGYLFLNDDSYINPFTLNNINFDSILMESYGSNEDGWGWINRTNANGKTFLESDKDFLGEICLYRKPSDNMSCENKKQLFRIGWSDFFYIPAKYSVDVKYIFEVAYKHRVFLEMAIPQTFQFFNFSCTEHCYLEKIYTKTYSFLVGSLFKDYLSCIHIHPIKYSNKLVRKHMIDFFAQSVKQFGINDKK